MPVGAGPVPPVGRPACIPPIPPPFTQVGRFLCIIIFSADGVYYVVCHSAAHFQRYDGYGSGMFPLTSSWRPTRIHCMQENRFMHLASLEQQRELMRYMNSLNEWLGHDVEDRQAELRGVSDRLDQLHDDLNRLGLSRGPCKLCHFYMSHIANIHSHLLTFSPAARA